MSSSMRPGKLAKFILNELRGIQNKYKIGLKDLAKVFPPTMVGNMAALLFDEKLTKREALDILELSATNFCIQNEKYCKEYDKNKLKGVVETARRLEGASNG